MNEFGAGELSSRYDAALDYVANVHRTQRRKFGEVPYLAHLLRVSGLALDYGASEDVAIAALLHDAVEDCGGVPRLEEIRNLFGDFVAGVVFETSDSLSSDSNDKAPWQERKKAYLERLAVGSEEAVLISGCDKLDNVASLSRAINIFGVESVATKFHADRSCQFWYFESIALILRQRSVPVVDELENAIIRLKEVWK